MKMIFEKAEIGGISSRNRIVRSATQEGLAVNDGKIGTELVSLYKTLSEGGTGIIITSMMGVDNNSRVFPNMVKINSDSFVDDMRTLTDAVHNNGSRIVVQLSHCGAKASPDNDNAPLSPSNIASTDSGSEKKDVKGMTKEEINNVVHSFALAAARCKNAGADGIQIHGAHGYLISQFLSPYYNKRTDEYGGSIMNRAKFLFEVYDAIRLELGNEYPVWVKINCSDFVDDGLTVDESQWVCRQLDIRGINGIEVSGGLGVSAESSPTGLTANEDNCPFSEYAISVADSCDASVISVGGFRTPDTIEKWLNKGSIEAISLCRPIICEPNLPSIWVGGENRASKCISCNRCFDYKTGFGCKVF